MKRVTIEAYNGIGKDKKLAGKREVDQPETLQEAVALEKSQGEEKPEESVLEYYWSSKTIEIQRQIRAGTTMSAKAQLAAIQAYAKANPDSDVAKTLAALKIGVEEAGNGTESTEGAAPEAPPSSPTQAEKPEEKPAAPRRRR